MNISSNPFLETGVARTCCSRFNLSVVIGGSVTLACIHVSFTGKRRSHKKRLLAVRLKFRSFSTALLLNEVSKKKSRNFETKFPKCLPKFAPKFALKFSLKFPVLFWQVLPPNFTRFFPLEISNVKSDSKSNFTNTLLQAWQP